MEYELERLGQEWVGVVVSSGTTRTQDIVANVLAVLRDVLPEDVVAEGETLLERLYAALCTDSPAAVDAAEELHFFYDFLYNLLNEVAPPGTYFGGLEGDPACVGFFPVDDK